MEGPEPRFKKTSDLENSLLSFSFMGKADGKNSFLKWEPWGEALDSFLCGAETANEH